MDENKSMSIAVLGVVAVIAVVSVVLLLSNAQQTAQVVTPGVDKVFGGAARQADPTARGLPPRLVDGKVGTDQEEALEEGVPYRSYQRTKPFIPSYLTSCRALGPNYIQMGWDHAQEFEVRYDVNCRQINGDGDSIFCCPTPNYATGEVEG